MVFFLETFSLIKVGHIPIDRARLALQNCIYHIFIRPRYRTEKIKIKKCLAYTICSIFQYFDQMCMSEIDFQKMFYSIL
jgi:hypothetical protein